MSNAKVPLKFQIFSGAQLIREEVVTEAVIKVGKLASSHLRVDDESVSRMHAVIEVNGPHDVQLIDLGSTRGTVVNGQRITKTALQSGDDVLFGDVRVVISFLDEESTVVAPHVVAAAAAAERARPPAMAPTMMGMPAPQIPIPGVAAPQAPVYQAPAPVYQAPAPVYQAPAPVYQAAAPVPAPFQAAAAFQPQAAAPAPFVPAPFAQAAAPAAPAASFSMPVGPNPVAAEVEVHDGSRALEVQSLFKGVVVNTRHLSGAVGSGASGPAKGMMFGGLALLLVATVFFVVSVLESGAEIRAFDAHIAADKEAKTFLRKTPSPSGDIIVFGGMGLGLVLVYMGLKRQGKTNPNYTIGTSTDADMPVGSEFAGAGSHQLVAATGGDYVVNVTPSMTGEVVMDGQAMPLSQWVQMRGASFPLPERGQAKIDCGQTTFLISSTPRPRILDVPFLIWKWSEQAYTVGSATVLILFLLMIMSVPPDPKSLSLDLFNSDNRFVNFLIKPPEEKEEEIPEWLKKKSNDEQGGKGKRHKDEEGKMGKKTSKNKEGLFGLKGPKDNPDPHLAKKLAEENVKNAGILGVLKMQEGSHLASIFGRDTAVGSDAENVLGGLIGNQIGEAYGVGGLGLVGTGAGGGGTGEGTIGLGNLGTIGKGGGGGSGSGYGRGAGGLGGRRAKAPEVMPGQANVRGSLDKEIIRRIIRRHINEIKYCYEQELTKKADLGGRVSVQFTIAATGQVVASVLQTSTMGSPRVEQCVVQAVRRWEFPKPLGGGLVIVSYPFAFTPAGGASE